MALVGDVAQICRVFCQIYQFPFYITEKIVDYDTPVVGMLSCGIKLWFRAREVAVKMLLSVNI